MNTIKQLEFNGITVGDLFCGAGIGGLGAKLAGIKTVYAFDNNRIAVDTFNRNVEPVAYLADANQIEASLLPYTDIITAGFPCKPFSVAGKGLGIKDQKYGNLGTIAVNIILNKQPKAFLLENVKGILSKSNMPSFEALLLPLTKDYNITWQLIDCSEYGVPQKRERVFVIGLRKDLEKQFTFPLPTHPNKKNTVLDAIGDLPKDPCNSVPNHARDCGLRNDEKPFVHKIPVGGNWKNLPVEDQKTFMKRGFYSGGGRTGALYKVDPYKPAKTILSSPMGKATAQILHWEGHQPRRYTVRECLRLQSVPDSFIFDESISLLRQYERCSGIPTLVSYILMNQISQIIRSTE
jgi:DNA (cytosine-5)-methyltransferase 1